ncbi:MAG: hypothetical protein BAJALOKI1v1_1580007 [Promethearchaeota archaeon]|nr:MAG: hypothetical protein BAJALOKI1v1_1580007 [Candidatus Lokiarchaeota archaeon]
MRSSSKENPNINDISISLDEKYHIYKKKPLYEKKFKKVMSYHQPGISAVEDTTGAYHIDIKGNKTYNNQFMKTFGYYEGIAAVKDETGSYHIDLKGIPIYHERYDWVGNFQDKRCSVRDKKGKYFHIKKDGLPAYPEKYYYSGDFKYGIAVVYEKSGLAKHIDKKGNQIQHTKFEELNVFHKGFAIAKDREGYFHINKKGAPLYNERYKWIEPFYNGQAFCCKMSGEKIIINEQGEVIQKILSEDASSVQNFLRNCLMNKLVGYWDTQIIYSVVKFGILDLIKSGINNFSKIKRKLQIPAQSLKLIIKVLILWDFIYERNETYGLKYLGKLLTEHHPQSLKYAALMWGSEHYMVMSRLFEALQTYKPQFEQMYGEPVFRYFNTHKERGEICFNALSEYTVDYEDLISRCDFSNSKILLDIGGGSGNLILKILERYENVEKGIIFDLPYAIKLAKEKIRNHPLSSKIEFFSGDFFDFIPIKADCIILSRVLHDWNDTKVQELLKNIKHSLLDKGRLIIFETIVPENDAKNIGTTLNFNLLVTLGGRERTLREFKSLFNDLGFQISHIIISKKTVISIIITNI